MEDAEISSRKNLCLTILGEHGGWMTAAEICRVSDGIFPSSASVRYHIRTLIENGDVVRRTVPGSVGRYGLSEYRLAASQEGSDEKRVAQEIAPLPARDQPNVPSHVEDAITEIGTFVWQQMKPHVPLPEGGRIEVDLTMQVDLGDGVGSGLVIKRLARVK